MAIEGGFPIRTFTWEEHVVRSGWRSAQASGGTAYLWWPWQLFWAPTTVMAAGALDRMRWFADRRTDFTRAFHEAVGQGALIDLRSSGKRWGIVWELLLEAVQDKELVAGCAVVHSLGAESGPDHRPFDVNLEPVRVLVLCGAESGLGLREEIRLIRTAWRNLPSGARTRVSRPIVRFARREKFVRLLGRHRPHVLWFSGHGRLAGDRVELLFAGPNGGEWVDGAWLAAAITKAGACPAYCVFWACETGKSAPASSGRPFAPPLFVLLAGAGVRGVLAMQEPIDDKAAIAMSHELFRELALGHGLEWAVARVRAALLAGGAADTDVTSQWAVPTVWVAGISRACRWHTSSLELAEAQTIADDLMGTSALITARPVTPLSPAPVIATRCAMAWSASRVWVHLDVADPAAAHLVRQALSQRAVGQGDACLLIVLDGDADIGFQLRQWAECAVRRLPPEAMSFAMVSAMTAVASAEPSAAWRLLCESWPHTLAVWNPSEQPPDWFWEPLLRRSGRVIVFSGSNAITFGVPNSFEVETLASSVSDSSEFDTSWKDDPLMQALSLIRVPIPRSVLGEDLGNEAEGEQRHHWLADEKLFLGTSTGLVMTGVARSAASAAALAGTASELALHLLQAPPIARAEPAIRDRLRLRLSAIDLASGGTTIPVDVLDDWDRLLALLAADNRPAAACEALALLPRRAWRSLSAAGRLNAAWACVETERLGDAKMLLSGPVGDPMERLKQRRLNAEVNKSLSDFEAAFDELELAFKEAEAASGAGDIAASWEAAALRNDRARLMHHVRRQFAEAAEEYQLALDKCPEGTAGDRLRAVILRNLAECRRDTARAASSADLQSLSEARNHLMEADGIAQREGLDFLHAEIAYEAFKVDRDEPGISIARRVAVNEAARRAAVESGHRMLVAIVDVALVELQLRAGGMLWHQMEPRWLEAKRWLEAFVSHGWAARKLVDGLIIHASRSANEVKTTEAVLSLLQAAELLNTRPQLNRGSDRHRRAVVAAGLTVLAEDSGAWERLLASDGEVATWVAERNIAGPDTLWQSMR